MHHFQKDTLFCSLNSGRVQIRWLIFLTSGDEIRRAESREKENSFFVCLWHCLNYDNEHEILWSFNGPPCEVFKMCRIRSCPEGLRALPLRGSSWGTSSPRSGIRTGAPGRFCRGLVRPGPAAARWCQPPCSGEGRAHFHTLAGIKCVSAEVRQPQAVFKTSDALSSTLESELGLRLLWKYTANAFLHSFYPVLCKESGSYLVT